jgi:hypothetical protein
MIAVMGRRTIEMPSDGAGPKKISPGESEDLPELSAGSSESEDLPDPTGGTYPAPSETVKQGRPPKGANCAFSGGSSARGNVRSLP